MRRGRRNFFGTSALYVSIIIVSLFQQEAATIDLIGNEKTFHLPGSGCDPIDIHKRTGLILPLFIEKRMRITAVTLSRIDDLRIFSEGFTISEIP
jgi:hypothetical protein